MATITRGAEELPRAELAFCAAYWYTMVGHLQAAVLLHELHLCVRKGYLERPAMPEKDCLEGGVPRIATADVPDTAAKEQANL